MWLYMTFEVDNYFLTNSNLLSDVNFSHKKLFYQNTFLFHPIFLHLCLNSKHKLYINIIIYLVLKVFFIGCSQMDEFTSLLNQIQAITSGVETLQSMNDLNHILDSLEFKNVPVSLLIQFFEKIPENYKKQINHSYIYDVISNNFQTLSPLLTYIDFNKLNKKQQMEIIYQNNNISNEISIPQSYFRNIHNTNQKNLIHIQSLEKKKLKI